MTRRRYLVLVLLVAGLLAVGAYIAIGEGHDPVFVNTSAAIVSSNGM